MAYWGGRRRVWEYTEGDRLSKLPDGLKEIILDQLPLKEAVKTSILSREWRYVWTGLSKLVFDRMMWMDRRACRATHLQRMFSALKGPIREFHIDVASLISDVNEDFWFKNLAEKGVEEIEIYSGVYLYNGRGKVFEISRSMFQCQKLRRIKLTNNRFIEFPLSSGFPNLVTLELKHVSIGCEFLSALVSLCPLLETLIVTRMIEDWPESGRDSPLVLSSLSLKTLHFHNVFLGNVFFGNVPELTRLSLSGTDETLYCSEIQTWSRIKFLSSLPGIKELSFHFSMLQDLHGNCPAYPLTALDRMVLLGVKIYLCNDLLFALCLIQSAPQLQSLVIYLDHDIKDVLESDRALKMLESRTREDSILSNVSKLWIHEMTWRKQPVMLLKIILLRCPNLETVFLKPHIGVSERTPKELINFPLYSDKVQIIRKKRRH